MKVKLFFLGIAVFSLASVSFSSAQEATAVVVPTPTAVAASSVQKLGPITVTVELAGGQKISGALSAEVTDVPFRSSIGEVKVQLSEVAGIKLASAEDSTTTIILKNGDSITGAIDLKTLTVDTEWGSAKINSSSVLSILMLPDLKWNASIGLSGKRWSLVDIKTGATNAPNGSGPSPSSGSSSTSGRPNNNSNNPARPSGSPGQPTQPSSQPLFGPTQPQN